MDTFMPLRPRMSEKAYALSQVNRTYVIDVPTTANKDTVAKAVTAQFEVAVETVRIVLSKGKAKRTVRKGGRSTTTGKRSDVKKAYVTLKEGNALPFFAEVEAEAKKAEEAAEKAAKKDKKKEGKK